MRDFFVLIVVYGFTVSFFLRKNCGHFGESQNDHRYIEMNRKKL